MRNIAANKVYIHPQWPRMRVSCVPGIPCKVLIILKKNNIPANPIIPEKLGYFYLKMFGALYSKLSTN